MSFRRLSSSRSTFDGTVAFKETPPGGGDQGAIGFAGRSRRVVFVGRRSDRWTRRRCSSSCRAEAEDGSCLQRHRLERDTTASGADDTDAAASGSTLQQMQAALISPMTSALTSTKRSLFGSTPRSTPLLQPAVGPSRGHHRGRSRLRPAHERHRRRHALVPRCGVRRDLSLDDRGLPHGQRPQRLQPHQATDRLARGVDNPRRLVRLHLRRRQRQ